MVAVISNFQPGPRLIDGTDLNVLVQNLNNINGNGTLQDGAFDNITAGASGNSATITIFPPTASKGKAVLSVTDQTGNTQVSLVIGAMAAARTITLPDPGAAANFVTSVGVGSVNAVIASASVTANATITYANVTGLSQTVQVGTYKFRCVLPSTVASGTGGIKYAFNYTTTVLSAIEATGIGYTASAVAVQHTTTTTTQTDLFTQAAVVIMTLLEGTMTVTTGGTIDVQVAQNTSNASNTIALLGGSFELTRIA